MASTLQAQGNNNAPVFTTEPTIRTVSSGSTALTGGTTTDVSTFTRNANERVDAALFVTNNTLNVAFTDGTTIAIDGVVSEFRRTATANQAKLSLICGATGRTADWMVLGFV